MTYPLLPKILLLEDPAAKDENLLSALRNESVRVTTADAGGNLAENVAAEDPHLLLADARSSGTALTRVREARAAGASPFPGALVLVAAGKTTEVTEPGMDFLTPVRPPEDIVARIRWHLQFEALRRKNQRLEAALEANRLHASIGAIADSVAHNLNNVLGIIFGYMHLLKVHHEKPEMVLKHHGNLETAVNKAAEMVRRFGDAARETQSEPEPVQVTELLSRAAERFCRENNLSRDYSFSVTPSDLSINTRYNPVEDALVALLNNAWESYAEAPDAERAIEISAASTEDGDVSIRIRDRGRGLDPEIEATMFEPFTGTKGSDGLGLAVARRCFRNLGGDLYVTGQRDGGVLAEVRHPR